MDLAESVEGKVSSYMKPKSFDHKFEDSNNLLTSEAKSRFRGYLSTFGYMVLCGLLLLIGGGTFFIYESVMMNNMPATSGSNPSPSGRSIPVQETFREDIIKYSTEFQVIAFVFIGVGAVLFMIGVPLATQFYRRYRVVEDSERSPILDCNKMTTNNHNASYQCASISSNISKKKTGKSKRKSKVGSRTPSSEGFRFAAHRHPSMNQISIDNSGFFDHRFSENSSVGSSEDELPTLAASPKQQKEEETLEKRRKVKGFFSRLLETKSNDENTAARRNEMRDYIGDTHDSILKEDDDADRSNDRRESSMPDAAGYGENQTFDSGEELRFDHDGLYNLGQRD